MCIVHSWGQYQGDCGLPLEKMHTVVYDSIALAYMQCAVTKQTNTHLELNAEQLKVGDFILRNLQVLEFARELV